MTGRSSLACAAPQLASVIAASLQASSSAWSEHLHAAHKYCDCVHRSPLFLRSLASLLPFIPPSCSLLPLPPHLCYIYASSAFMTSTAFTWALRSRSPSRHVCSKVSRGMSQNAGRLPSKLRPWQPCRLLLVMSARGRRPRHAVNVQMEIIAWISWVCWTINVSQCICVIMAPGLSWLLLWWGKVQTTQKQTYF